MSTIGTYHVLLQSFAILPVTTFPSLVSLNANRGVMLQISLFYVCYQRSIFVIDLSLLLLFHFYYHLLSFYDLDFLLSITDNSYVGLDYV